MTSQKRLTEIFTVTKKKHNSFVRKQKLKDTSRATIVLKNCLHLSFELYQGMSTKNQEHLILLGLNSSRF